MFSSYSSYSNHSWSYKRKSSSSSDDDDREKERMNLTNSRSNNSLPSRRSNMVERSKYIPLRLTHKERKMLHLLEASLNVSQYTDRVDVVINNENQNQNQNQQQMKILKTKIVDISAILTGLLVAADYKTGQTLLQHKDFKEYEGFFSGNF
jgi:hypothetical protein